MIARLGIGGGTGHVIEYRGSAIRALSMEERMTVCNMSIEAGARAGMIAPDDTTFAYLKGRPRAPQGAAWDEAVAAWRAAAVATTGATFDREEKFDARHAGADDHLRHQPGHGHPDQRRRSRRRRDATRARRRSRYMGLEADAAAARPQDRRRVHRQLHELAPVRPARRGRACSRAARSPTACACWSCPARSTIKTAGRGRGAGSRVPRRGRRVARGRLLDVHRDERRPARSRASTRSAPATATSKGGRARAGARSSPAR